jgi:hypothetical protein
MAKDKKPSAAGRMYDSKPDPIREQAAQKAAQATTGKDGHREGVVSDKTGKILTGARNTKARYTVLIDPELKDKMRWLRIRTGRKAYELAEEALKDYIKKIEKKDGPIEDPYK